MYSLYLTKDGKTSKGKQHSLDLLLLKPR